MKNATEHAKKLKSLIGKHKSAKPVEEMTGPLEQLAYSFLLWETTRKQADTAFNKLNKSIVDYNDLRVSDPAEIVEAIGKRYSRAEERAIRLRDALHSIYVNEHAVTLDHLPEKPKRAARQYLKDLQGMVPFVSARVVLLALGGHAMPVDEALASRLKADGAADPDADLEEIQSFLEKQIRSSESGAAHAALMNYVEKTPAPTKAKSEAGKSAGRKRSTSASKSRSKKTTRSSKSG